MSSLSCLHGDNVEFVEEMYSRYLQGDKSIGEDWHRIFSSNLEVNKAETCNATKVDDLAKFFRSYGHFFADLDPLSPSGNKQIDYQKYSNLYPASDAGIYRDIYCKNIGFEIMHISSYEERMWLQEKIKPIR